MGFFFFPAILMANQNKALATETEPILQITSPQDPHMDCNAVSKEISYMDEIIYIAEEEKRSTKAAGTGVGVVQTVGSFMIGSLGGVLGIFAAGALIDHAADNKVEKKQELQAAALQRRSLMAALYDVKQCQGPLVQQLASIEPAAGDNSGFKANTDRKPNYND
jgi:hypothetical protein